MSSFVQGVQAILKAVAALRSVIPQRTIDANTSSNLVGYDTALSTRSKGSSLSLRG